MIEAELPDGTVLEFPAGTSPDVVQRAVRKRLGVAEPQQEQSFLRQAAGTLGNLAAGAVRGAGSIGATLLAPQDILEDALRGRGLSLQSNRERRQAMDEGLRSMGADPESLAFQAGKIGGEIAGTAGTGGVLARGVQATGRAPMLAQALRSGGMAGGPNMATRVAGGAASGGASAALVNPEEAGTGALIGGSLPLAMRAARGAVTAGRNIVGASTGAGEQALKTAYESGKAGGAQAKAFRENMRGQADLTDVLDDARANLDTMRQARAAEYRANMAPVTADKTVLDLNPIGQSVQDSISRFTFKGQARNPQVLNALQDVQEEVANWAKLDPAEFHTPEGLDALKQRIGAIRDRAPIEANDVRKAIGNVYNSVKQQIEAQAPDYAKAMKDYTQASELLDEISRSLSLNNRASADTAMRKLQSVMRNNVNTNYGARLASLQELEQQGGRQLMPQLAGQALNEWMPRGIQRATAPLASLATGSVAGIPGGIAAAATSSPRLMGEAAYFAGRANPFIEALRRGTRYAAPVLGAQ
jgi:hypothetical protein